MEAGEAAARTVYGGSLTADLRSGARSRAVLEPICSIVSKQNSQKITQAKAPL